MPESSELPHPLPDELAEVIARRFRVLSDPLRIKLLDALREGGTTVRVLARATGASEQSVSNHLRVLSAAGIVRRRREDNFAHYAIADESVPALCDAVCGALRSPENLDASSGEVL